MSSLETTFEVRARKNGQIKMFHVDARDNKKAKIKARKYGQVLTVRKVDFTQIFGNIENLDLNQTDYVENSPYETAIAMDEFIWQKQKKKIKNREKDKKID